MKLHTIFLLFMSLSALFGKTVFTRTGVYPVDHWASFADIYTINDNESEPAQITNTPHREFSPNLSSDGKYIYFIADYEGEKKYDIYRIDSNGGNRVRITELNARVMSGLDLSKSGKSLVFFSIIRSMDHGEIYIVNIDGSSLKKLTDHVAPDGSYMAFKSPFFASTDESITFCGNSGTGYRLYNLDLENHLIVKHKFDHICSDFSISPDGRAIAFIDKDESESYNLSLYSIEDKSAKILVKGEYGIFNPCFTADGNSVFFAKNGYIQTAHGPELTHCTDLYMIKTDGTCMKKITDSYNLYDLEPDNI